MFLEEKATPEPPPPQTISQTFLAAASYIETHGWCQNEFETPDGRVCLYGALAKVTSSLEDRYRAALRLGKKHMLLLNYVTVPTPIQVWNDHISRTVGEVISLLREAAKNEQN